MPITLESSVWFAFFNFCLEALDFYIYLQLVHKTPTDSIIKPPPAFTDNTVTSPEVINQNM